MIRALLIFDRTSYLAAMPYRFIILMIWTLPNKILQLLKQKTQLNRQIRQNKFP